MLADVCGIWMGLLSAFSMKYLKWVSVFQWKHASDFDPHSL
jgi:hypothetical protein